MSEESRRALEALKIRKTLDNATFKTSDAIAEEITKLEIIRDNPFNELTREYLGWSLIDAGYTQDEAINIVNEHFEASTIKDEGE